MGSISRSTPPLNPAQKTALAATLKADDARPASAFFQVALDVSAKAVDASTKLFYKSGSEPYQKDPDFKALTCDSFEVAQKYLKKAKETQLFKEKYKTELEQVSSEALSHQLALECPLVGKPQLEPTELSAAAYLTQNEQNKATQEQRNNEKAALATYYAARIIDLPKGGTLDEELKTNGFKAPHRKEMVACSEKIYGPSTQLRPGTYDLTSCSVSALRPPKK